MPDTAELHRMACDEVTRRVDQIADADWTKATPCTEWDVRALMAHIVSGTCWVAPLVEGLTIPEIGDRFSGDLLGDDPKGAWHKAAATAIAACDGGLSGIVHISAGDVPATEYIGERILDLVMHAWDLARAIGADERVGPELVGAAQAVLREKADLWRSYGALGPAAEVGPDADAQTILLAESGRRV